MRATSFLFAFTAGVGAFLLFVIQPMVGKAVLPAFGGAPAVWAVCLAFFQTALLAGYAYAHLCLTGAGPEKQAPVHLLLLLGVMPMLPLEILRDQGASAEWAAGSWSRPEIVLLLRLLRTIGLPYIILASTAPLLQRWFLAAQGDEAIDPYPLYSASNIGSLAALFAYPFLVERFMPLDAQARWWSIGFIIFSLLLFACMLSMAVVSKGNLREKPAPCTNTGDQAESSVVHPSSQWMWLLWSAVPASLLAGVTTHITTDVAPLPLFWILPLATYLLSFVLVFARTSSAVSGLSLLAMPVSFALLLPVFLLKSACPIPVQLCIHLAAFFTVCLVFHGMLVATRPPAGQLTSFYLTMAAGGAAGGLFNGIAAPHLFSEIIEYPLVLVLASVLYPASRFHAADRKISRGIASCAGLAVIGTLMLKFGAFGTGAAAGRLFMPFLSSLVIVVVAFWQPLLWGLIFTVSLLGGMDPSASDQTVLLRERSFYGAFRVVATGVGRYHLLEHGNIHHGGQLREPGKRKIPLFYYSRESPVGSVFREMAIGRRSRRVAIVGLGTGGIAAYGRPWQSFTFYEIDPMIVRIAKNPDLFSFLRDSAAKTRIVTGDARLNLMKVSDRAYDLIILDAYSSDAIPMHLLTQEAIGLYMRKLSPDGMLLFHISNRYLDLEPVLGAVAASHRLVSLTAYYEPGDDETLHYEKDSRYVFGSKWLLIASNPKFFGQLARDSGWKKTRIGPPALVWTDTYSSVWLAYGKI